ncbi:hypothetical protein MesoLj113b_32830 [Mesorhizobium sp. 113-3-3]|nr:hypothetical protein MesoLj113b_32830 [Mesorhizobium sp. 113-3-3]
MLGAMRARASAAASPSELRLWGRKIMADLRGMGRFRFGLGEDDCGRAEGCDREVVAPGAWA